MKENFQWKEDYSVGVSDLDNDHKKILAMGWTIVHTPPKAGKEAIAGLLHTLESESAKHFSKEESLMNDTRYPQAGDHHEKHDKLMAEIGLFIKQFRDDHMDTAHLADFLTEWILHHILNEDKKFQEHFKRRGIN
ncbi:MAG: bacteriohemerythrin [Deltaproteobacteria bacterium]|nr:bacteriohemerythrin [Deltaproteobacteria bacterium]